MQNTKKNQIKNESELYHRYYSSTKLYSDMLAFLCIALLMYNGRVLHFPSFFFFCLLVLLYLDI